MQTAISNLKAHTVHTSSKINLDLAYQSWMVVTVFQKVSKALIITELPLIVLLEEILFLSVIWLSRGKAHAENYRA